MPMATVLFLPLAHLGHWYFIPLYVAPAVLVFFAAIRSTVKERRRARRGERGSSGAE